MYSEKESNVTRIEIHCLEGLRKTKKCLTQVSRFLGWHLNPKNAHQPFRKRRWFSSQSVECNVSSNLRENNISNTNQGWPASTHKTATLFVSTRPWAAFVYTYIKGGRGTECNYNAVIYKQRHLFLFLDIKREQYIRTIRDQYFSGSICLFHIEITVKYLFSVSYILLLKAFRWPRAADTSLGGRIWPAGGIFQPWYKSSNISCSAQP